LDKRAELISGTNHLFSQPHILGLLNRDWMTQSHQMATHHWIKVVIFSTNVQICKKSDHIARRLKRLNLMTNMGIILVIFIYGITRVQT